MIVLAKYCPNCGKEINSDSLYCTDCSTNTNINKNNNSNGIAIGGFVCSLLGLSIIGLVLSCIGLSKSKKLNGNNKGFAIAGIILSAIKIVLAIILLLLLLFSIPSYTNSINNQWQNIQYSNDYYDK